MKYEEKVHEVTEMLTQEIASKNWEAVEYLERTLLRAEFFKGTKRRDKAHRTLDKARGGGWIR